MPDTFPDCGCEQIPVQADCFSLLPDLRNGQLSLDDMKKCVSKNAMLSKYETMEKTVKSFIQSQV